MECISYRTEIELPFLNLSNLEKLAPEVYNFTIVNEMEQRIYSYNLTDKTHKVCFFYRNFFFFVFLFVFCFHSVSFQWDAFCHRIFFF